MSSIDQQDLDSIYTFAVQLGKDAGKILLERAQERFQGDDQKVQAHEEKANAVDLVTQTDEGKCQGYTGIETFGRKTRVNTK
jgi:myo-inositol-1(or 4)-monophosphatase